jgi:hypothetical protein
MKKPMVKKTKKRTKTKMAVVTAAVLMAVGVGNRSAVAGILDSLGFGGSWLNYVIDDTNGLKLNAPTFDLMGALNSITGGGAGVFSQEVSKLLFEDDKTLDLRQDALTLSDVLVDATDADGNVLDFMTARLTRDSAWGLTSNTATMATATKAKNNDEIYKKVAETSGKVYDEASKKSYNSSLEAQQGLSDILAASGKVSLTGQIQQQVANNYAAVNTANVLKERQDKENETRWKSNTKTAFDDNSTISFVNERALRELFK